MSNGRYGGLTLNCDLCDARLQDRESFDRHMRLAHDTTSLKPRIVANRARELLEELDRIAPPRHVSAPAKSIFPAWKLPAFAPGEAEDYADRVFYGQFNAGWLTFRLGPMEWDGFVVLPFEMGDVSKDNINHIFHKEGSFIQFRDAKNRDRYVKTLKELLAVDDEEMFDSDSRDKVRKFIAAAATAEPWEPSHRGRYRR